MNSNDKKYVDFEFGLKIWVSFEKIPVNFCVSFVTILENIGTNLAGSASCQLG